MRTTKQNKKRSKTRVKTRKHVKTINKQYFGGALFDPSETHEMLSDLNNLLQKKCSNLEIRIGMMTEMPGKINVYSPKLKNSILVCLYYNNDCIASIQLFKNDENIELRSFTNEMFSGKKYNTLLRFVLILISNKIKVNGQNITVLHSSALNPISAHLLMSKFNSMPVMDESNDIFLHFMNNLYKKEREPGDMYKVVNEFYKINKEPIEFEIPLTREIIDKSMKNFKILVGEINPDDITKQLICP